jgi:hypothetical protein
MPVPITPVPTIIVLVMALPSPFALDSRTAGPGSLAGLAGRSGPAQVKAIVAAAAKAGQTYLAFARGRRSHPVIFLKTIK